MINSRYRKDAEISEFVASRDLKKLCEAGMLEPRGEKRARTYVASAELRQLRQSVRIKRPLEDPYEILMKRGGQAAVGEIADAPVPRLPGL